MRVICSVLVLACLGSAHAEVEDSGALGASELSAASVAELETKKTQAEQANDALATLLEGVTSTAGPSETVKTEQSEAPVSSRSSEPRADEQAVAEIPAKVEQNLHPQAFQNIRAQLAQMSVADGQTLVARFLEDQPTHREARITLARLQVLDNDPAAALLTLDTLVASVAAKNHSDWQPWFWAGTAYLALGEIESARRMLDVAVSKEGQVVEIWVQLAVLEQELDNHAAALQYIGIAEQIDAQAAQVHLNRAYSLERLGEFDAALSAYQQFMSSRMSPGAEALRPSVMRRMALLAERQQAAEESSGQSS